MHGRELRKTGGQWRQPPRKNHRLGLEQFRAHYGDPSITKWDIFHYVYAVLHHPEYRQRYAANLRRELPRIPFVGTTALKGDGFSRPEPATVPTLSSRAEQDDSLANHPAKSRDLVLADAQHGRREEFSARTRSGGGSDENASMRPPNAHTSARSFDSAVRTASGSDGSAQDDEEVFWAFVRAGQRLAEIHVHYQRQPEYPLTKKEKEG